MTNKVLIALIAVIAAALVAGAAVATVCMVNNNGNKNTGDGNNGDNGDGDNNGDDSNTGTTNVTVTGIVAMYDGGVAPNKIYVTYDNVQSAIGKITAAAKYSDNTTKAISEYTRTSTLSDSYAVGDTFIVTVTNDTYSASVEFAIMDNDAVTAVITCESGTADCYSTMLNSNGEYTITFSGITEDSVYSISGTLKGNIIIDVSEDYDFELELSALGISSSYSVPIDIESANNVTISAKKDTSNTVVDNRDAVDEDGISACIYSLADLDIQGKGTLNVKSENNNGIHTKDDLKVKNLTLCVECEDNALKGNDSVTIQSGTITLIAKTGDGIKTTNSDISSEKSVQRGTVTVCSDKGNLILNIYAACDGIDAAYDVSVYEGKEGTVTMNIFTDQYSEYSESVTEVDGSVFYLKTTSLSYDYSVYFIDSDSNGKWVDAEYYEYVTEMYRGYYYYSVSVPSGYDYMKVYTYTKSQDQGQSDDYYKVTKQIAVNHSYNVLTLSTLQWSTYGKDSGNGHDMGPGGQDQGNTEKGEYSTKGIKADNSISISGGTIHVESYDDSIHANGGGTLENGSTGIGDVTVSGGTITLFSKDDGIHGDGDVTITNGSITVTNSYEGIEGYSISVSGGDISVTSSDDGLNGTSTSGTAIAVSGGKLYVYAGGDGLDSNSTTSGTGIVFSGGDTVVISTSGGNSSIDSERGWKYSGGRVLAISPSGAMTQEISNYTSISGKVTISSVNSKVSSGTYVTASSGDVIVAAKLPCSMNGLYIAYCGTSSVTISTSTGDFTTDSNGVYWA